MDTMLTDMKEIMDESNRYDLKDLAPDKDLPDEEKAERRRVRAHLEFLQKKAEEDEELIEKVISGGWRKDKEAARRMDYGGLMDDGEDAEDADGFEWALDFAERRFKRRRMLADAVASLQAQSEMGGASGTFALSKKKKRRAQKESESKGENEEDDNDDDWEIHEDDKDGKGAATGHRQKRRRREQDSQNAEGMATESQSSVQEEEEEEEISPEEEEAEHREKQARILKKMELAKELQAASQSQESSHMSLLEEEDSQFLKMIVNPGAKRTTSMGASSSTGSASGSGAGATIGSAAERKGAAPGRPQPVTDSFSSSLFGENSLFPFPTFNKSSKASNVRTLIRGKNIPSSFLPRASTSDVSNKGFIFGRDESRDPFDSKQGGSGFRSQDATNDSLPRSSSSSHHAPHSRTASTTSAGGPSSSTTGTTSAFSHIFNMLPSTKCIKKNS